MIIRRTLIDAALVASLAVVYLGGVSAHGHVDRRFHRSGYDAQAAMELEAAVNGFSERMREQIDLDALRQELLAVVAGTVQPTHASVWLRPDASNAPPG